MGNRVSQNTRKKTCVVLFIVDLYLASYYEHCLCVVKMSLDYACSTDVALFSRWARHAERSGYNSEECRFTVLSENAYRRKVPYGFGLFYGGIEG